MKKQSPDDMALSQYMAPNSAMSSTLHLNTTIDLSSRNLSVALKSFRLLKCELRLVFFIVIANRFMYKGSLIK